MIFKIVRKVKTVLTYFLVYYPIYFFSFLTPRKKNRWVFGNGKAMSDNAKYLYLDVTKNHKEIESIWICTNKLETQKLINKGVDAYYYLSIRGIYYLLTGGVFIASHYLHEVGMMWALGRAKYINLWHGIPLKNLAYKTSSEVSGNKMMSSRLGFIYRPFNLHLLRKPDIFLSTSATITKYFSECFRVPMKQFIEADYPRCKPLTDKKNASIPQLLESNDLIEGYWHSRRKTSIYMPTMRDSREENYLSEAMIDWKKLQELLEQKNDLLLLKLHPRTPMSALSAFSNFKNIKLLPNQLDIYPLLPHIDVLITDYSSIFFDYMHLKDKHTIFFPFDYEQYVSKDRDLAFDYDENINGIRVNTFDELLDSLKTESDKNIDIEKNKALYEKFWGKPEDKKDLIAEIKRVAGLI